MVEVVKNKERVSTGMNPGFVGVVLLQIMPKNNDDYSVMEWPSSGKSPTYACAVGRRPQCHPSPQVRQQ
jgi:hypothetical protein